MATAILHQPIGFLPLSFSLSDDSVMRPPSSSSESVNDILDTLEDPDENTQILGDDVDRNYAEKVRCVTSNINKSSSK